MYNESKVTELMFALQRVTKSDCVLQISEHFTGYFDELGITIIVQNETSDDEVCDLKNIIMPEIARIKVPFSWMIIFQRHKKQAAVLFPDGQFTGPGKSSRVAVVLDPHQEQLEAAATVMPVWAVDSPDNRSSAEPFWGRFPNANQDDIGITLFRVADIEDRYKNFVEIMSTVEEHHWGLHQLYVLGLKLTEQAQADMSVLGFDECHAHASGFIATKNG